MNENIDKYKDILEMPHHVSTERKQMSLYDRAAQFAPFAALTGFDDDVEETERITDKMTELSEDKLVHMNERLNILMERIKEQPEVVLTVFEEDDKKAGGSYKRIKVRLKRYDETERTLYFTDGNTISLDMITDIEE